MPFIFLFFRNNNLVIKNYRGVLQCSVALANALTDEENEHLEELLSAEKVYNIYFHNNIVSICVFLSYEMFIMHFSILSILI